MLSEELKFDVNNQNIFRTQVEQGKINFGVHFLNTETEFDTEFEKPSGKKSLPALGPNGSRLKDMCLWGDQHRILQVIINLVSNSLKFTPEGGKVEVRIKCIGEADPSEGSRNS